MESFAFQELFIIFGLSIIVLLIGHQLRLPPVVGFLLTGVLSGPHGLGLVQHTEDVETLAQIGIILLLFGIGMEFSVKKLVQIKRLFLLGGSLQVGLTIVAGCIIGQWLMDWPFRESIFLGCLLSMSSTAIVLRLFEQRGESNSPQGRVAISILIFQDMIAIPMILLIPLLATTGDNQNFDHHMLWPLAKGIVILITVFFSAERIIPPLLLLVARTRNKELFLLSVFALCFGVAWLTSSLGLSLTIGAFLAGLIISESEFSSEAISHIFPFQALCISFFFVSVGMLLDLDFMFKQPITILMLALTVLCIKGFIVALTTLILGMPIRTAVIAGIALSQIGEFSFVLAKAGVPLDLLPDYYYQLFLAVSLLTMAINPVMMNFSSLIAKVILALPWPARIKTGFRIDQGTNEELLENHIVIIGFGISGKNLARSSILAGVPYIILEMNPDTVREYKKQGEPIYFGDASHLSVLEHVQIQKAKALAVLINDPVAAQRIVKLAREVNPSIYIIVRTRYVHDMPLLNNLGADEVIPDEFGTSVEIFSRVLRQYHVPTDEIDKFIGEIRADGYEILRTRHKEPSKLSDIKMSLSNVELYSFRIQPASVLVGKTLIESQIRQNYGLTVLLIRRGSKILATPASDTVLMAQDVVVVVGERVPIQEAQALFVG